MTRTRKIKGKEQVIELTERKPVFEHKIDYFDGPLNKRAMVDKPNMWREYWTKDGKLHRDSGPAYIIYHNDIDNDFRTTLWYKDGKMHRIGGPAEEHYGRSGALKEEVWWMDGLEKDTTRKVKKGGKTRRRRRLRKGTKKRRKRRSKRH